MWGSVDLLLLSSIHKRDGLSHILHREYFDRICIQPKDLRQEKHFWWLTNYLGHIVATSKFTDSVLGARKNSKWCKSPLHLFSTQGTPTVPLILLWPYAAYWLSDPHPPLPPPMCHPTAAKRHSGHPSSLFTRPITIVQKSADGYDFATSI